MTASQANSPDKIHYQVTRPPVPVENTDGQGIRWNQSPIGFPKVDMTTELGYSNPTLVNPEFNVGQVGDNAFSQVMNYWAPLPAFPYTGLPLVGFGMSCTVSDRIVTVNTNPAEPPSFVEGQAILVDGLIPSGYNGTYPIHRIDDNTYSYTVAAGLAALTDNLGSLKYTIREGDIIYVAGQVDPEENGYYQASGTQPWVRVACAYEWDGTEADNKAGTYSEVNGDVPNHYRKGYSLEEVRDFVTDRLGSAITFGKADPDGNYFGMGAFSKWFASRRKVNVGGGESNKQVWIDGAGLASSTEIIGVPDAAPSTTYSADFTTEKQIAFWGLSNTASETCEFGATPPIVRDYPRILASEVIPGDPTSGGLPTDVPFDSITMAFNPGGPPPNLQPFTQANPHYHRNNSWHNNITINPASGSMAGRNVISINSRLDQQDQIVDYQEIISGAALVAGSPAKFMVSDITKWNGSVTGSCTIESRTGILPPELTPGDEYAVIADIGGWINLESRSTFTVVAIASTAGFGSLYLRRLACYRYVPVLGSYEIGTALNALAAHSIVGGYSYIRTVVESHPIVGSTTNYYCVERKKNSLVDIVPKGSGTWAPNQLTYQFYVASGHAQVDIFVESTEVAFVTFFVTNMSNADALQMLKDHNELIPYPFLASYPTSMMTNLFTVDTRVNYSNSLNKQPAIHSKKTFVHLPTPGSLKDGTKIELDISIPIVPDTDSFGFNTIGSVSGYKSYVTQPRAYVLSGTQKTSCTPISFTYYGIDANTLILDTPGITGTDSYAFTTSNVRLTENGIFIPSEFDVGESIHFTSTGTLPAPLVANAEYTIVSNDYGVLTVKDFYNVSVTLLNVGAGTSTVHRNHIVRINLTGAVPSKWNGVYYAKMVTLTRLIVDIPDGYPNYIAGTLTITGMAWSSGAPSISGLTERSNLNVFGAMPELAGNANDSVYHQSFGPDSLVGVDGDKRILLATVWPTSSSTFQWRIDNEPQLRMMQWSMMNVFQLGGAVGSPAYAVYKRNLAIAAGFNASAGYQVFDFSVDENPLTYASPVLPAGEFEQSIMLNLRIRWPETYGGSLSADQLITDGSIEYQASVAYRELIADFMKTQIRVEQVEDMQSFLYSANIFAKAFDENHGDVGIPTSLYDGVNVYNNVEYPTVDNTDLPSVYMENAYRWMSRSIYTPTQIRGARDTTQLPKIDSYRNIPQYYIDNSPYMVADDPRASNSGDRYVPGSLNPVTDPVFAFGAGVDNAFTIYLKEHGIDSIDNGLFQDVQRAFWDSHLLIPTEINRKYQNYFTVDDVNFAESVSRFCGSYWQGFARLFSTDGIAPVEHIIQDIPDYAAIQSATAPPFGYSVTYGLQLTYFAAIASNPITTRFFDSNSYERLFVSLNELDATNAALQEFMRNYIVGYANRAPLRFYNGTAIAIMSESGSSAYYTDTGSLAPTQYESQRIYDYAVYDWMTENSDPTPTALNGKYLDDNFISIDFSPDTTTVGVDLNPSWMYFDEGMLAPTGNDRLVDLITVSGEAHIASRDFYATKMRLAYSRYRITCIFSTQAGRWIVFDYRQAPTSYLTPTFGNTALKARAPSARDASGALVPIADAADNLQPIWNTNQGSCYDVNLAYLDLATPYWRMTPLHLNMNAYPFLTFMPPYDVDGNLVTEMGPDHDTLYPNGRFLSLAQPSVEIGFTVPNNRSGGIDSPDTALYLFQPHLWKTYWHMRTAVSAMTGCDIPLGLAPTGGEMSDPVLGDMFAWPYVRNLGYTIPNVDDMGTYWFSAKNDTDLAIDAIPTGDPSRSCYTEFEAMPDIDDLTRAGYLEINSEI